MKSVFKELANQKQKGFIRDLLLVVAVGLLAAFWWVPVQYFFY